MTTTQLHATRPTTFEVHPIAPGVVCQLQTLDDLGRAPRFIRDEEGGSPLRCCLRLSRPGDEIMLASYAPLRRWALERGIDPGAYDEAGPVFIHAGLCDGARGSGFPVDFLGAERMFRAYGENGSILFGRRVGPGEIADQASAERVLGEVFADERVAVVHARAIEFGCFTFEIRRYRGGADGASVASATSISPVSTRGAGWLTDGEGI
jgi:Protein of unknown function (DUF1203)